MRSDTGRYPYLPFFDRPKITWPNNARVAFWVSPNIEFYELAPPPSPGRAVWQRPLPDVLGYAYRDYGNRAGVWRMIEVMQRFGVRGTVSLNAALCDHSPEIIEACARLDWEFFSHGVYNTRLIYGMDDDQLRQMLRDSVETISRHTGRPVRGWLAPALSGMESVFDILPELGITYTLDLLHDDQPLPVRTRAGRLISLPYSVELNDMPLIFARGLSPQRYETTLKAQFDQLYEEGAENGMVMCIPIHPFLVAQPNRIAAFTNVLKHVTSHEDVWIATAGEIADWYYAHHYDAIAAALPAGE
jgi:allantoinase